MVTFNTVFCSKVRSLKYSIYFASIPPSTRILLPVTKLLAGLAKKMTAPRRSSGFPQRPAGVRSTIYLLYCSSFVRLTVRGVSIYLKFSSVSHSLGDIYKNKLEGRTYPGHMQLTCISLLAHSFEKAFVICKTPPFEQAYAET